MATAQRLALTGMVVSGLLAILKITVGIAGHSTAVFADGLESAGDVFSSGFVFLGLFLAAKPADAEHPYGHGRAETLTGLLIGLLLTAGGALISFGSFERLGHPHAPLETYVVWPLVASLIAKSILAASKFRIGRKTGSAALCADAWNDAMDSLSAVTALVAVGLAFLNPERFLNADRYGGFAVGLIVILAGIRIVRDTVMQLMDTMPDPEKMDAIRAAAASIPGVLGVEKCFARKTGMRYHVDLHLEVDPNMTVRHSHEIAHEVRERIVNTLNWVADVLVHVEPAP